MTDLIPTHPADNPLLVPTGNKDTDSRLRNFARWQRDTRRPWHMADLAAYRDYLLTDRGLLPSSAAAHLSAIRSGYRAVMRNRARLYAEFVPPDVTGPADRKAHVDEVIARIQAAIDPDGAPVKVQKVQDRTDSQELRLTAAQVADLLGQPRRVCAARAVEEPHKADMFTAIAYRDTALIALALATGARVAEVLSATGETIQAMKEGHRGFYIPHGKGNKARHVPYGALAALVDAHVLPYLRLLGIQRGPLFDLKRRAAAYRIESYPIVIAGELRAVRWHDLRRTYARRCHDAGMATEAIQANLGHESIDTTRRYIGDVDFSARVPSVNPYALP